MRVWFAKFIQRQVLFSKFEGKWGRCFGCFRDQGSVLTYGNPFALLSLCFYLSWLLGCNKYSKLLSGYFVVLITSLLFSEIFFNTCMVTCNERRKPTKVRIHTLVVHPTFPERSLPHHNIHQLNIEYLSMLGTAYSWTENLKGS